MSGYIGTQPVPQATQTRDSFTSTAGQTSFSTSGYSPGYLDVYLNGVHLQDGTDYAATNGSDVVLTTGAAVDDVVAVVAYTTFEVASTGAIGTTELADDAVSRAKLKDEVSLQILDASGTALKTIYGAGS